MFVSCLPQRHHVTTINWQKKHVQATSRVCKQEPLKQVKNEVAHIAVSVRKLQQGTTKRTCWPTTCGMTHSVVPKRSTNARSLHPLRGSICVTSAGCEPRQSVRVRQTIGAHVCPDALSPQQKAQEGRTHRTRFCFFALSHRFVMICRPHSPHACSSPRRSLCLLVHSFRFCFFRPS